MLCNSPPTELVDRWSYALGGSTVNKQLAIGYRYKNKHDIVTSTIDYHRDRPPRRRPQVWLGDTHAVTVMSSTVLMFCFLTPRSQAPPVSWECCLQDGGGGGGSGYVSRCGDSSRVSGEKEFMAEMGNEIDCRTRYKF